MSERIDHLKLVPDNVYGVMRLEDVAIPSDRSDGVPLGEFERLNGPDGVAFFDPPLGSYFISSRGFIEKRVDASLLADMMWETKDQRRIIVRQVPAKTKRVLVVECPAPWHNGSPASVSVQYHGETLTATGFRIEERPL